jgi:hypothetical protein
MIIYRARRIDSHEFYEYLVEFKDGVLCQPEALPERYSTRTKGVTQYVYGTSMVEVDSLAFPECEAMSLAKVQKSLGIWIVVSDCIPKGHYTPESIDGKAQYFSIPIEFLTRMGISQASILLRDSGPEVLYHGTMKENTMNILASGLQHSDGMLGKGSYLGTFWKATRYACLTQDYKPQEGVVFRVFAFPQNIKELPDGKWKCQCGCKTPDIADHTSEIPSDIHLTQSHLSKDGRVKNEEWLIKGRTFLQQHALVDETTFPSPHYDPLYRGTRIK